MKQIVKGEDIKPANNKVVSVNTKLQKSDQVDNVNNGGNPVASIPKQKKGQVG